MNEQDLRDCFAMFALLRVSVWEGEKALAAKECYEMADAMLEARKNQGESNEETNNGIAAVAPKRPRKR